jgi:2-iminoacetate synthase
MEYLVDYASAETRAAGEKLIATELEKLEEGGVKRELFKRLELVRSTDKRDMVF